ncbi:hypothetical protein SAMD00019534_023610 [Acytostelium subglobosum LB1]|uniref:hypothetical protein n=1 Tax=Acytostelium subglobosum LB1 TaxID=1410327 RepID=UPI000644F96C|nr:hypothetical protein SAMD00019534_023610 [Acytostelium subglobosum LB1]GAM19186.1 hypothetical protein SAMD00019534_023610 [Acytostelium subglobosum LB1]|eukprot:XP_012757113.1 hypothetical protein SAMD00019534_023610 [Acytostelium subglobosum LB1]
MGAVRLNDETGHCPAYRSKYSDWTDVESMLKHHHYGLLRYRIKQNDDIKFESYTPTTSLFKYGQIDDYTFNAVYSKYRQYFNHNIILKKAIKTGQSKHVIDILLKQTQPIVFERDVSSLIELCDRESYELLKYLLDSGHYNHIQWSWSRINIPRLFEKASASSIRCLLNPNNNNTESLIDRIKQQSCQYIPEILAKGDQQLIDQLLFKDGVKQFDEPITAHFMLPITASPTQQLERFERLLPQDDTLHDRSLNHIATSKSAALSLLSSASIQIPRQDIDIGDEQRLIFVKLGELEKTMIAPRNRKLDRYIVHEYIVTGDCMLLPYLIIHPKRTYYKHEVQNIVNEIIKHGNLTQLIVAIGLLDNELIPKHNRPTDRSLYFGDMYNAFIDSDNMTKSLECIQYLNQLNVIQSIAPQVERKPITLLRTPPMFVLAFLMSSDNKIFPLELLREKVVLMEPQQIDYVLNNMPSFFDHYKGVGLNELDLIVYTHYVSLNLNNDDNNNNRGIDIFRSILDNLPRKHFTKFVESTIHYFISYGRMNLDAVKVIMEHVLHLAPAQVLLSKIGIQGVVKMLLIYKYDYHLEYKSNDLTMVFRLAVDCYVTDLAKHIFKYQKGLVQPSALNMTSSTWSKWNID